MQCSVGRTLPSSSKPLENRPPCTLETNLKLSNLAAPDARKVEGAGGMEGLFFQYCVFALGVLNESSKPHLARKKLGELAAWKGCSSSTVCRTQS